MKESIYFKLIEKHKNTKISARHYGRTSLNQYLRGVSGSRANMYDKHYEASVAINDPDERLVQSGIELEMQKHLAGKKLMNDSILLYVAGRYANTGLIKDGAIPELTYLLFDKKDKLIRQIVVPAYEKFSKLYGYNHRLNPELSKIRGGASLSKGYKISTTNSERDDGGLGVGRNAMVAFSPFAETEEDAIMVRESWAKRTTFSTYRTFKTVMTDDYIPLNLYGGDDEYLVLPALGHKLNDDGPIFSKRRINMETFITISDKRGLQESSTLFDEEEHLFGNKGTVIDIIVMHNPPNRKNKTKEVPIYYKQLMELSESRKKYEAAVTKEAETLSTTYNVDVENELHTRMVTSMCYDDPNVMNNNRNRPLPLWTIEVTVEYKHCVTAGQKIAGEFGNKGEVGYVVPDELMPHGVDIIQGPTTINNRSNPWQLIGPSIAATAKVVKKYITDIYNELIVDGTDNPLKETVEKCDSYIAGHLKIIGTIQYDDYINATMEEKIEMFKDIIHNEYIVKHSMDDEVEPLEVIERLYKSKYANIPKKLKMPYIKKDGSIGVRETYDTVEILPAMYLVLDKMSGHYLASSSPNTNHINQPTSSKNRNSVEGGNSVIRAGETETRNDSHASAEYTVRQRDRATSLDTHRYVCNSILKAEKPTNIDRVDPPIQEGDKERFKGDTAVETFEMLFKLGGMCFKYTKGDNE